MASQLNDNLNDTRNTIMSINTKALQIAHDNKELGSAKIRALILLADIAVTPKEVTEILKEVGVGKTSSKLTQVAIVNFLEEGRSETELYELILEAEAVNSARWVTTHDKTRVVINKVYAKFENPVTEEPASAQLKADVAALVPKSK
jgi:hypothetical protein